MTVKNNYRSVKVEFHILQSFPVTCLNRDDVGAPKTAVVGGVTRARVSSQSWKRAIRTEMANLGVKLAIRSKKIADLISNQCAELGADEKQAEECGVAIAKAFSKDTLHFFTEGEAHAFAELAKENAFDESKLKPKDLQKLSKKVLNPSVDGLDIALFGRMVAQATELNVQAATSVAHAISTHGVVNEIDFFTALDDLETGQGSAHMGSLEFNSATYYRYVSLDLGQLADSIGEEGLEKAVAVFTKALYIAVPSARQATQSGASFWDYAKILVRKGQGLQLSLDQPIAKNSKGYLIPSIERVKTELKAKGKMAGSLFGLINEYELSMGGDLNIDSLIENVSKDISAIQKQ